MQPQALQQQNWATSGVWYHQTGDLVEVHRIVAAKGHHQQCSYTLFVCVGMCIGQGRTSQGVYNVSLSLAVVPKPGGRPLSRVVAFTFIKFILAT